MLLFSLGISMHKYTILWISINSHIHKHKMNVGLPLWLRSQATCWRVSQTLRLTISCVVVGVMGQLPQARQAFHQSNACTMHVCWLSRTVWRWYQAKNIYFWYQKINLEILWTANKFGMPYLMVGPGTTLERAWKLSVGIDTRWSFPHATTHWYPP